MSRIGKTPVLVPAGVTVNVTGSDVAVKGPKGELHFPMDSHVSFETKDQIITVVNSGKGSKADALHGFFRAQLSNYIDGVSKGWTKSLELSGVGYRATVTGVNLVLTVGFSHPVTIVPPPGITFAVVEGKIVVSGIDKQLVGQMAAIIREVKKPEPYKGKGIKYVGEHIRKKAGKAAKAVGGAK